MKTFVLFSFFFFKAVRSAQLECGYDSCPSVSTDRLNVHIVCHSHDDVGWLKTVDQYYSGSYREPWHGGEENQRAGVQYTLDTVVRELAFDPNKKYIQVETAFFWRWWTEQDHQMKELVHELVNSGQMEFIGGGWSMSDEAAAHYVAIIDQMALGLKKLKDTFGDCGIPKIGWQIDPFGHSREQSDIFAEMGMDGFFFGRLDWREKEQRLINKTAEMIWITSDNKDTNNRLLTGILYNHYSPPEDFCWDLLCNDEPLMDNPNLHDYNIDARARDFVNYAKNQHKYYTTSNILITMGMDFHYQAAHTWYKNLDKLITYINTNFGEEEKIHLMYSTPSCYVKALNDEMSEWSQKSDDFFPYASDPHAYWTGYFSSRPTSKRLIREASGYLQAAKQITSRAVALDGNKAEALLNATERLSRAVGVAQHHDAITGTEKQHVANDYHLRLHSAISGFFSAVDANFCHFLNISQCDVTENIQDNEPLSFVVYNPMAQTRSTVISLPVESSDYIVRDENGEEMQQQVTPIAESVKIILGRVSNANFNLVFVASDVPPLGLKSFTIEKRQRLKKDLAQGSAGGNHEIFVKTVDGIKTFRVHAHGISFSSQDSNKTIDHSLEYYKGHRGNNSEFEFRASGAYIFRPLEQTPVKIGVRNYSTFEGPIHTEVHVTYENFVSEIFRIPFVTGNYDFEVEWLVGPIGIEDEVGKEFISKFEIADTEFNQNGVFFTDSNGRQTLKRIRDLRPSFDPENATLEEPVSSNYYPINSAIFIRDENLHLTVTTERAQGGSSIHDGQLELMIHRRLLDDDSFGVGEPLNEVAFGVGLVAMGKHFVSLDTDLNESNLKRRLLANQIFEAPIVMFPSNVESLKKIFQSSSKEVYELPSNVNLLTFEPWFNGTVPQYLVRLENIFEKGEHDIMSQPVTVSLVKFFGSEGLNIGEISFMRETTLGGNIWLDEHRRLSWKLTGERDDLSQVRSPLEKLNPDAITLNPFEIRTFVLQFA